ncbi:MAG TPA: hypothetical protein VFB67_06425 [Candidatus Polarisedimenticolaceae bacterium]|nr:hypothetical protein [Candidatus Polarisedimenticolaceae bacterium]
MIARDQVTVPAGHWLTRLPWVAGGVGVLATALSLVLASGNPRQFAFSWLLAFLFFASLAIGGMYFVLVHYATQAGWGVVVRRLAENMMGTIPLLALLFLPIVWQMRELFPWVNALADGDDHLIAAKAPYLNTRFFLVRAAVYFTVWVAIALLFARRSRAQDRTGGTAISLALKRISAPALIALALTQTFAAFDWIMSLDPTWYSTIFGVYWFAGSFVSTFAFLVLAIVVLRSAGLMKDVITLEHFHDLGKLLFAFTVFWAYIGFSQFFLIWYGNIPEETIFFRERLEGSWRAMSFLLAAGHFAVPFFFFMPRSIKRKPGLLALGAGWMLLMHFVDMYWLVMPAMHPHGVHIGLSDLAAFAAVGGLFAAVFGRLCAGSALVPVRDPRLAESLSFENV